MKQSLYNSEIQIDGKHTLIYNSFSGKFVVVKNKIIHINGFSLKTISKNDELLYSQLCEAGIVVKDNVDEIALLKDVITKADNNEDEFILHINPTLDCNFRCWYCYENHKPLSKMDDGVMAGVKCFVSKVLENKKIKRFSLGFFGGEPLMQFTKVVKPIIESAAKLCSGREVSFHVSFTSNGALINDSMVSFLAKYDCGFQITLDGGKPHHDKTRCNKNGISSFDRICANIKKLLAAGVFVIVRVNCTSENIDSIASVLEVFRDVPCGMKKNVSFDFQRVWQDRKDKFDTTEERMKSIRTMFAENGFSVLANYIPHNVECSCYGDKLNHALINYDGMVFGCTARDFVLDNSLGRLSSDGTINYFKDKYEKRNWSKLSKPACLTCRIAPICGGGCKQRAFEDLGNAGCTFGYTSEDMDGIVTDIFEHSFLRNNF